MKNCLCVILVVCICVVIFPVQIGALESTVDVQIEKIEGIPWLSTMPISTTITEVNKYYSTTPNSLEWKSYVTSNEMIAACRIDQKKLNSMTTEEVVDAVLCFPMLVDLYAYNEIDIALEQLALKSDAYRELRSRPDGAKCLQKALANIVNTPEKYHSAGVAMLSVSMLLSDSVFGGAEKNFMVGTTNAARAYITTITTPGGSTVQVIYRGEELSAADVARINNDLVTVYSNATLLAPATTVYNCHNFAWNTTARDAYWMNQTSAQVYMEDGRYDESSTTANAILYYGDSVDHSACVLQPNAPSYPIVIAKWGYGPLMQHRADYGPYSMNTGDYSYWS